MAFRVVVLENETNMRIKLNNVVLEKGERDIWIPVDDISVLVVDNLKINLTARMMSVLAEHNVGIVICGTDHLPVGYFGAYDSHSRSSKIIMRQIEFIGREKDWLWEEILKAKIRNQAAHLNIRKRSAEATELIMSYLQEITKGDATNREAHAAKVYFNELMGCTFSRGNEDILMNSGLDFGYAIVRSFLARLCVGYGLNTQIGLHHRNEYNRFNLVDDLIEPMRPIIDYMVYGLLENEDYFKPAHRHEIINFVNHRILYRGKKMYICNMMEEYVEAVASVICGRADSVEFPDILNYLGKEKDEI